MPLSSELLSQLRSLVGAGQVLTSKEDLIPYSFDGTAALNQMPGCVAFVTTTEQIAGVLRLANATRTPLVTRGSGTGLSGGSLPSPNCIVMCTARMNRILEVDQANLTMLVEPGVNHAEVLTMLDQPALRLITADVMGQGVATYGGDYIGYMKALATTLATCLGVAP